MEEAEVLQILTQVNVVRRECEIVSVAGLRGCGRGLPAGGQDLTLFPILLETRGDSFR